MSFLSNRFAVALLTGTFAFTAAQAATNPKINVSPKARIVSKVDNSKVVARPNTHLPILSQYADLGRVAPSTPLNHMFLMLSNTDEQEYALRTLLDAQQDKSSPNYHQWLTPETFGQYFGAAKSDIAQVTAWLQDSGFTVEKVTQSGRLIQFSGTSGAVEAAFHTEMHQYMVNGEVRMSNATDISIPAALSEVVLGPTRLNNFKPKPHHTTLTQMVLGADGQFHRASGSSLTADTTLPDTTLGNGAHVLGGSDFPVIFDSQPLIASGITGAGVKIGILGQTDVLLSDISTYRYVFGLPPANPNIIVVGNDPGFAAAGDDVESDLDLEVSGANAPGATIDFYTSGNDFFSGGITAAGVQIIENNTEDIISLSYGDGCEQQYGIYAPEFNFIWEQASSQGISVFVSSGDAGPDDCQDGSSTGNIYSVDILSSTPYNVAVGGTMFNEGTATGATQYWGAANTAPPYESALSYIPEIVWNESALDPYGAGAGYGGIVGGTSGISILYPTPAWQAGPGITGTDPTPPKGSITGFTFAGPHRYLPDVSMPAAGGHDGVAFCSENNCILNSAGQLVSFYAVGGTSVSAPSMAGVQALINQKNGGRQGLPNYYYYRLAALQSTTNCNAATLPSSAGATCAFHDVQTGNNFIPSARNGTVANGNYIGWTANPGYDLTVGLGSLDVNNVATQWKNVTFNATTTAFTLTPTTGPSGQTENFTIAVKPVSGTGTPTGQVSIIAQALFGSVGFVTLASGTASGTFAGAGLEALPAGTYNVYAHYAGDTTYAASNSANISVTIGTSATSIKNTPYYLAANGQLFQQSTFTYGQNVYIDSAVCNPAGINNGGCNSGTPTGAITYTLVNANNVTLPVLVSPLDSFDDAYLDAGLGLGAYDIKPNYPTVANPQVLPPGTYVVSTSYNGDTTYQASTGTPFTIVIGPATEGITVSTSTPDITTGGTVIVNASMATIDAAVGGVAPTGTMTFTDTTTGTVLGTGTLTNGAVVFSVAGKVTTTGAHTITATYSGDANYTTATSVGVTVTVTTGTAPTVAVSTTVGGVAVTTSQVGQTVAIVATLPTTVTSGTAYFYDGTVLLGTGNVSASTHTATRNQTTFTAGTHTLTATYGGNSTTPSASSTVDTYIVTKNSPVTTLAAQGSGAATVGVPMDIVLVPSPQNLSPANPVPTGNVNYLDGTNVLGTAPLNYYSGLVPTYTSTFTTAALKPGTHVLSGQYLGDANYGPSTSNTITINIGLTTLSLTVPSSVGVGIPFTVSGKVTPLVASTIAITGTVTFTDTTTNTVLGTANVTGGVATLTTATVSTLGTHTITAVYSGDANYYTSSTTSAVSLSAVTPGFTIAVNPTSLTIIRGNSGTLALSATSYGNYAGYGLVSVTGLPANASYIVSNSPYVFNGVNGTQTFNLYITTFVPHVGVKPATFLWLPALALAAFLGLRRKKLSVVGRQLVVFGILMCGMMATTGCGGNGSSFAGTTQGNTTPVVTMTGTGTTAASPNIAPTATFNLTVQ